MTSYISTDPSVLDFVSGQNAGGVRGGTAPFAPAVFNNGIAGPATDNVIGFSSLSSSGTSVIAMGSGFNSVVIDGMNSSTVAAGGADNFSFTVDPTGLVTLTDTTTGKSQQVSGVSFLIFNGAAHGADGNGNPDFQQMYFIGNSSQTEVTELYNAAFGRQPDLAGVEYYANQLKSGYSFQQIATEFMASPEFSARYGLAISDKQFVTSLYQNVLHRAASASELSFYTSALANYEAGSIVDTTNPVAWSREHELLNFTTSPENQADTAGFIVNTSGAVTNGLVYSTPAAGSQTATQVLTQAEGSGVINTQLIDPSSLTSAVTVGQAEISPALPGQPAGSFYSAGNLTGTPENDTVILSAAVPNGALDSGTVYGADSGGSVIFISSGQVHLYGTGNSINEGGGHQPIPVSTVTTIYGFVAGDHIVLPNTAAAIDFSFLTPSASAPIQGGGHYGTAINVGNVGGGSLAEVAAAAAKVYVPSDTANEQAVFYGQTSSGGTAIYSWFNYSTAPNGADTHNDHAIHTDDFAGGVILVGVPATAISASTFHS